MCAMIPMFRVFSREYLRGIRSVSAGGGGGGCGQKERATRARAHDRVCPWASRYVLEVSIPLQKATRGGAQVSSASRGNEGDDSKGFAPGPTASGPPSADAEGRRFAPGRSALPTVFALRSGLALVALAGALLLLVATFATIIQITVGTTTKAAGADTAQSGWDRHGPALIVLAVLAIWLLAQALRGSRAAMAGLAAAGVAALLIAMIWDRPHVHDTGSVGDIYAEAHADPASGYYLETLGGALLLLAGGGLLLLGSPAAERTGARRRERQPRPDTPSPRA